jgi:uncharacterized protein YdaU (DUF1376 family)
VNYIELHIGDYDKATAHLTGVEDGMYGRLVRRYYDTEKPLPADVKAIQRLVRARSRDERQAVETVLEEFFQLTSEGYRHGRCDEEIERYREKQPAREAKRENERERQRRARARRADLFEALRENGIVPPYDATTGELERLLSRGTNASVTQPVTRDVTANQSPDTRHQKDQDQKRPPEAASVDPLKDAIDGGVEFLGESGVGPKQARSVIGMIRKRVGDDTAVELLAVAQREHVADPVAWLQAAAKRRVVRNGAAAPSAFELAE